MRRKQFLALLLTGAMTVGMTPAAAFAAEEPLAIEGAAEFGSEEASAAPAAEEPAEDAETPAEEQEPAPEETPAPEVPAETPEETPAPEVPTETPEETPTPETPTETPAPEVPTETPTPENPTGAPVEEQEHDIPQIGTDEAAPTPTPEVEGNVIKIGETVYTSLAEAVAAATSETIDGTLGATKIVIGGTITLDSSINVSAGQSVMIVPGTAEAQIVRGPEFKGDMFTVNGGILYLSGSQILGTDGEETSGSLTVNGAQADTSVVSDGSIAAVSGAGSVFSIDTGATLTGNVTIANGGAVRNEGGSVTLMGGTITGCQAAEGGAIYSDTSVNVRGSLNVTGNTKLDGVTASNIQLTAGAGLVAAGQLTEGSVIGVNVKDAVPGTSVISIHDNATDLTIADILPFVTYEAEGMTLDENGMVAEETPEVSPTPTPEEEPLKLTGVSMEWTGENSAKVVCISNKDGWYYADWVTRGSKAPKFDVSKPGVEVQADHKFTVYLSDLDPNKAIDVYVLVKDKEDNLSKKQLFQLDENSRPKPTPTPHTPVIPKVTESTVRGLENPLEFYPGVFYEFTVTGAGTKNDKPGLGDVKWVPLYWSMSTNPADKDKHASWKIGATNGIKDAATYNIYVFFQKWEYDGSNWKATDTIESAGYKFRSKAIVIATSTPTPTVPGDNGYYGESGGETGESPDDPDYYNDDTEDTGNSTADAVATADESPVGTMTMLAMASLLAGGYVLVRRRKKEF